MRQKKHHLLAETANWNARVCCLRCSRPDRCKNEYAKNKTSRSKVVPARVKEHGNVVKAAAEVWSALIDGEDKSEESVRSFEKEQESSWDDSTFEILMIHKHKNAIASKWRCIWLARLSSWCTTNDLKYGTRRVPKEKNYIRARNFTFQFTYAGWWNGTRTIQTPAHYIQVMPIHLFNVDPNFLPKQMVSRHACLEVSKNLAMTFPPTLTNWLLKWEQLESESEELVQNFKEHAWAWVPPITYYCEAS